MSLSDLKKAPGSKNKKSSFTIDEFISDSENYAKGAPEIVSGDVSQQKDLARVIAEAKELIEHRAKQVFSNNISDIKKVKDKKVGNIRKKATQKKQQSSHSKYRHATFTLSEEVIEQLQFLSDETQLAKSHIIRILINELDDEEKIAQLKQVLGSKID